MQYVQDKKTFKSKHGNILIIKLIFGIIKRPVGIYMEGKSLKMPYSCGCNESCRACNRTFLALFYILCYFRFAERKNQKRKEKEE